MRELSKEIKEALDIVIKGLNYNFLLDDDKLDSEKMKRITNSKVSSFKSAKEIIYRWINSPNAPNKKTIINYTNKLIDSGETAINILRKTLTQEINYHELDAHKHAAAIEAKPLILEAILEIDKSIIELENKIEKDDLTFDKINFQLGYAERFAKGEFYNKDDYHKNWYNKKLDAVNICPFSTTGQMITLDNLNIVLPKPPRDKSKILFSDLPKKEQYWRRLTVPKGITYENKEIWDSYIKEEFRRRREGIWFMNNGKPVYLTGNHYFMLQWTKILDLGAYMKFRYAQLNMFYHLEACIVDKRCLGQLFVKSRRTGFTYSIIGILLNNCTSVRNKNFGMTSKSGEDAKKCFLKFRYALVNLPFFFLPVIKGKLDSTKSFEFDAPLDSSIESKKNKNYSHDVYLNTKIDYELTKNDSYDGQALYMYLGDEAGKWTSPNDYIEHFGQISPTMEQGGVIVGKAFIGSTVGAMKKGGSQFKELFNSSDVRERDEVTQMTASGLYSYFLAAQENMEAFTDKYGVCHKEKPKTKSYSCDGKLITIGSIDYLLSKEKQAKNKSDKALNNRYRAFPRTLNHAFRDESEECVFNLTKIQDQIEYNNELKEENKYVVGNFVWENGVDSDVIFSPTSNGRFRVAWIPSKIDNTEHIKNNVSFINDKWYPNNIGIFGFGSDPISIANKKGSKGSLHGKTNIITEGNIPKDKFIVEYVYRPKDENVFYEDVIKCVRFYGTPILIESNRADLVKHFKMRGYRNFCMNRVDKLEKQLSLSEKRYGGQNMSSKDIIDAHSNSIGTWIEKNVGQSTNEKYRPLGEMGEMPFDETLIDWLRFDPTNRRYHDATISSGLAIMACTPNRYKGIKNKTKKVVNMKGFIKKYNNKSNVSSLI